MIRHLFIALAGLLAASVAAQDAGRVDLRVGEHVLVSIDGDGRVSVAPGGAARISEDEQADIVALVMANPGAVGPNAALGTTDTLRVQPVEPGAIRISFISLAGVGEPDARLLVLENGYDRALRYRATIARGSRSQPTDVCEVIPMLRGYEHWPYRIDRIELTGLMLIPYRQGTPPVCE